MAAITLSDVRNLLGSLNGEDSPATSTTRDRFINAIIKDITSRRQWRWRKTFLNVAFNASGVSTTTLTSWAEDSLNNRENLVREVVSGQENDVIYTVIDEADKDNYGPGDNVVWVEGNEVDGFTLNIHETDSPTLRVGYYAGATALSSAGDTTRVPRDLPIAKGAYALLRVADDPDYNNASELREYENEIRLLQSLENRGTGKPRRFIGASERGGYHLGQVA